MKEVAEKAFDIEAIRADFPILNEKVNGKPLVYLDNAATSQKPKQVIGALTEYYSRYNANIHRGLHTLADKATAAYELTRSRISQFINAAEKEETVFTRGTTEGINLVANCLSQRYLKPGDEILISAMEHHSNIVPWQMVCERGGLKLKVVPMNDKGELLMDEYRELLNEKVKLVACIHVSNALGTVNPIAEMISMAHQVGALFLVDAAQSAPHFEIDVQGLDCDFLVFSGHKILGPTGVGVLFGKRKYLEMMPPWQGGGEMISEVRFQKTTYNELPYKFEAGTPNIADVIALRHAVEYLQNTGLGQIARYEKGLFDYAVARVSEVQGMRLVGTAAHKVSLISFLVEGIHPQDIGILLDQEGVAIRTGHHCAQPVMERFQIPGTCRASFAFYNTKEEIDVFFYALQKAVKMLR